MCITHPITDPKLMVPINALRRRGIQVVKSKLGNNGHPIIEVTHPLNTWKSKAVEITEMQQGKFRRVVNMIIWRGNYILWCGN